MVKKVPILEMLLLEQEEMVELGGKVDQGENKMDDLHFFRYILNFLNDVLVLKKLVTQDIS